MMELLIMHYICILNHNYETLLEELKYFINDISKILFYSIRYFKYILIFS